MQQFFYKCIFIFNKWHCFDKIIKIEIGDVLSLQSLNTNLIPALISILCFIPALVFHEVAHGFVAYKLGDPTAKNMGRLSLNPLKHLDIFGTVILPLILLLANMPIVGYAKPVPYNPRYFKNLKKGDLLVGLAGPLANLILALLSCLIAWLCLKFLPNNLINRNIFFYVFMFLLNFTLINLYLMMFNLLPIPPLDGSSVIALLVPDNKMYNYYKIQQYAMPVFMILLIVVPYFFIIS